MEKKTIPASDVNANHVRQILGLNDAGLAERVTATWGKVKTERDPERVKVVEQMRKLVTTRPPGDPLAGQQVFNKVCAQCHTIYGQGGNVGPDLTGVGRENLDAVLTNVLDPSLVIGAPYYVYLAKNKAGETFSGLLVEKSDKQVVLKDQTKQMVIPAGELEKLTVQNISMMPEGLEKDDERAGVRRPGRVPPDEGAAQGRRAAGEVNRASVGRVSAGARDRVPPLSFSPRRSVEAPVGRTLPADGVSKRALMASAAPARLAARRRNYLAAKAAGSARPTRPLTVIPRSDSDERSRAGDTFLHPGIPRVA